MSEPLHEANSICRAKIPQTCAMRSRKNTNDFTVFGVVSTPYLPNAWDRGFFRPRVFLWHRVLTNSAKMGGILVSYQSTFPCKKKVHGLKFLNRDGTEAKPHCKKGMLLTGCFPRCGSMPLRGAWILGCQSQKVELGRPRNLLWPSALA